MMTAGYLNRDLVEKYLQTEIDRIKKIEEVSHGSYFADYFTGARRALEQVHLQVTAGKFDG